MLSLNSEYARLTESERKIYSKLSDQIYRCQKTIPFVEGDFDCVFKVYICMLHDHPDIFWLKNGAKASYVFNGTTKIMQFKPKPVDGLDWKRIPVMQQSLEKIVAFVANNTDGLDNYHKMMYVHDFIINHTVYTHTPLCHSAYGCLIEHKAVCDGYSSAFQIIMQKLGIPCGITVGEDSSEKTGKDTHAWNYCLMDDGFFYFVDVTWDDPIYQNDIKKHKTYEYFCVTKRDLERTHRISDQYYVPPCISAKYNYYVYHNMYAGFYNFETAYRIISSQMIKDKKAYIKFVNKEETEKAIRDLIENDRIFTIPGIKNGITYWTSKSHLILTIEQKV